MQPLRHVKVVMYSRRGCHLCDDAWKLLDEARQRDGFCLEAVDIDGDAELIRQHGERVPVVAIDGQVRFWGRVSPVLLRRFLDAERR
jgi:glutaredoxin